MTLGLGRFRLNSLRSRLMLLVALALMPLAVMTVLSGIREREHDGSDVVDVHETGSAAYRQYGK